MLVKRKSNWYRPYYIIASGREYKLERISFYKDGKILVSTDSGYLVNEIGKDIGGIELPVDEIKVKRKVDFNGEIFAISKGKESYGNDLVAVLYIPAEIFNIHFVENVIKYKRQVMAVYQGDNDIYIETYIKSIDGELWSIENQYQEVYEKCNRVNLACYTEDIIKHIETLKELAQQYIKEKERMENLTIKDIEL